jgi:DNA-binding PadR family transcriptional regulator
VQEIQRRNGDNRLLPGNLYRLLNAMEAEGLIEIVEPSKRELARAAAESGANADRRRYFGLTAFGREVARAEAHRLEALVDESRRKRLITARPR